MGQFTCLYYWIIEPVRASLVDTADAVPALEASIESDQNQYNLAVFVDKHEAPDYARLTLPNLDEEKIPEGLLSLIQVVKEHLKSVLRLTYHPETNFFPRPFWAFLQDTSSYYLGLDITPLGNSEFDAARAKRLFIGSFPHREEVRLLIDGYDKRIPLQYRYLSLYKILELHYKVHGKWQEDELEALLAGYTQEFEAAGITRLPKNHIHALRDKCAHIKTGSSQESFGVTHLNRRGTVEVNKTLPIMSTICVEILNNRAAGDYTIQKLT